MKGRVEKWKQCNKSWFTVSPPSLIWCSLEMEAGCYLSPIWPTYMWRKICHVEKLWVNLKFLHIWINLSMWRMWRFLKFLHMWSHSRLLHMRGAVRIFLAKLGISLAGASLTGAWYRKCRQLCQIDAVFGKISFVTIYALLLRDLFCHNSRTFVWRKNYQKIAYVEKNDKCQVCIRGA